MADTAPERIWAWAYKEDWRLSGNCTSIKACWVEGDTEYVRADIHQAVVAERDKLKGDRR